MNLNECSEIYEYIMNINKAKQDLIKIVKVLMFAEENKFWQFSKSHFELT